jgi:hypothetical protein
VLEWHFGRLQVHQLIGHKVLCVRGWVDSPSANEAGADFRLVSLPQVLLAIAGPLAEALDYKLYGVWPTGVSVAVRTLPDAQGLLNTDAAVNFWLPDSVLNAADALGNELELTRSDVIRNSLFLHLYGRVFYEDCLAQEHWKTRWREAGHFDDDIMFSRSAPSNADQVNHGQSKKLSQRRALLTLRPMENLFNQSRSGCRRSCVRILNKSTSRKTTPWLRLCEVS